MKNNLTATAAIHDGYIPANLLAKDLGIESRDFRDTTLNKITFKNVSFIQVPLIAVKFITSDYIPAVILNNEDNSVYDYVLEISKEIKIGFWK